MLGQSGSIPIAKVFGIRIGATPAWFVLPPAVTYYLAGLWGDRLGFSSTTAYLISLMIVLLIIVSLLLHELGHALVARHLGIDVLGIDLLLFGGVARLVRDSDSPGAEFKVTAAGPAVSLALAVVFGALATAVAGQLDLFLRGADDTSPALIVLAVLAMMNAGLFLSNLLPAFPLDGGRLLHALVWKVIDDRHRATRVAGRTGQSLAYGLIALGVYLTTRGSLFSGPYLAFIGWQVATMARVAVTWAPVLARFDGVSVANIMDEEPVRLALPGSTDVLRARDEFFLRYDCDYLPVVDDRGRVLGVLTCQRADDEIASGRPAIEVGELVNTADAGRWCTRTERSLQSLFGDRELYAKGSLLAVDATGALRGVVTTEQLRVRYEAAVPQDPAWRRAAGLERRWPIGRRPGGLSRRREARQPEEVPAAKPRKVEA